MRTAVVSVGVLLAIATSCPADEPDRWEPDIQKFEAADQKNAPPASANLFVGSSSIRRWKLNESFPKLECINRGFGGSQMADSARYTERIVIPARPRVVIVYAGDNDIAGGKSPETIRDDYRVFRDKIRNALPDTKIVVIAVKPSPSRMKFREQIQQTNQLLSDEVAAGKNQVFVDVWKPMLDADGQPRPDLFVEDKLHMNAMGYEIWARLIEPHLARTDSSAQPKVPQN
ncbi:MAG: hypothetical protein JSS49_21455 [Planctomycetes bacterium]|nr:hypothetical protein [Planctomycetota bacterium]